MDFDGASNHAVIETLLRSGQISHYRTGWVLKMRPKSLLTIAVAVFVLGVLAGAACLYFLARSRGLLCM